MNNYLLFRVPAFLCWQFLFCFSAKQSTPKKFLHLSLGQEYSRSWPVSSAEMGRLKVLKRCRKMVRFQITPINSNIADPLSCYWKIHHRPSKDKSPSCPAAQDPAGKYYHHFTFLSPETSYSSSHDQWPVINASR